MIFVKSCILSQVNTLQFYYCKFGWSFDTLRVIFLLRELCTQVKSCHNHSLYHPITEPASRTLIMKTYLPSVPLWAAGWRMNTKLSGYVTWEFSLFKNVFFRARLWNSDTYARAPIRICRQLITAVGLFASVTAVNQIWSDDTHTVLTKLTVPLINNDSLKLFLI